jgi:hypothetical protein
MANVATEGQLGIRPLPADEYDVYLEHVAFLVASDASSDDVVRYLRAVEYDHMSLTHPSGDKQAFFHAVKKAHDGE